MADNRAKEPTIVLTVRPAPSAVPWDALWDWLLAPEAPGTSNEQGIRTESRDADGPSKAQTDAESEGADET